MKNYYEILQVSKNAEYDVIDRVYKLLIKKYHPDVSNTNNQKIVEINNAYEILSNPIKRKEYDICLDEYEKKLEFKPKNTANYETIKEENKQKTYISYNIDVLKGFIFKILSIFICCMIIMLVILISTGFNTFKIFFTI